MLQCLFLMRQTLLTAGAAGGVAFVLRPEPLFSQPVHHHLGEAPPPAKGAGSRAGVTQAGEELAAGEDLAGGKDWARGGYGEKVLRLGSEAQRNWSRKRLPAEVARIDTAADEFHPPGGLLFIAGGVEPHDQVRKPLAVITFGIVKLQLGLF